MRLTQNYFNYTKTTSKRLRRVILSLSLSLAHTHSPSLLTSPSLPLFIYFFLCHSLSVHTSPSCLQKFPHKNHLSIELNRWPFRLASLYYWKLQEDVIYQYKKKPGLYCGLIWILICANNTNPSFPCTQSNSLPGISVENLYTQTIKTQQCLLVS